MLRKGYGKVRYTQAVSHLDRYLDLSFVFILTTNTGVDIDFLILFLVYSVCTRFGQASL